MKNIRLNDTTYEGIITAHLPTTDGGTAAFRDEDEIVDPVLKTGVVITPTTEPQNIPVPEGFDGFDAFDVEAVTAAIDSNIVAGNIKKNVEILGVTGTLDTGSAPVLKTDMVITPSTEPQNIPVPSGYDGFGALEVDAVTAAIDANIAAGNIKKNVQILGVTGSYEGETPAPKTPTIQVAQSGLITVSGDGIVTTTHQLSEADDPAFTSANIAKNATIFGKDGAHEGGGGGDPSPVWTTFIESAASEMTITQVFEALDFSMAGKNGWLQVVLNQPTAPTAGYNTGKTYGAFVIAIYDGQTKGGLTYYKTGLSTLDTTNWKFGDSISGGAGGTINTMIYHTNSQTGKLEAVGTGTTDRLGVGGSGRYCFQECKMI